MCAVILLSLVKGVGASEECGVEGFEAGGGILTIFFFVSWR